MIDYETEARLKVECDIHNAEVDIRRSIQKVREMTAKYKFNDEEIQALSCLMVRSRLLTNESNKEE